MAISGAAAPVSDTGTPKKGQLYQSGILSKQVCMTLIACYESANHLLLRTVKTQTSQRFMAHGHTCLCYCTWTLVGGNVHNFLPSLNLAGAMHAAGLCDFRFLQESVLYRVLYGSST
eukprot:scaffold78822_cov18-Tisochrysis_lutea.AAC.1